MHSSLCISSKFSDLSRRKVRRKFGRVPNKFFPTGINAFILGIKNGEELDI